jgi:tRNA pseudouridine38-40 synthase
MRYSLEISYLGTNYAGWQSQPNAPTIQGEIEKALLTLAKQPIAILGSSRTDAGVHARQQFAVFDTDLPFAPADWHYRLNHLLPNSIAIVSIQSVAPDFHPRFAATARAYQYHICRSKDPFHTQTSYYYTAPLDTQAMNAAAALLLQHTDYQCFSKTHTDVHTYNCSIQHAYWQANGQQLVFHIKANRFLRGMVRAIVGTLLQVGLGKLSLVQFEAIILSKNRNNAGASVPAQGLSLCEVCY